MHRPGNINEHYDADVEHSRLASAGGRLEFERSKELILRHLPPGQSRVLDIGGGTGPYSFWLAGLGHETYLIDPVGLHVERATELNRQTESTIAGISEGDARDLEFPDASFDAVIMFGPLYHLTGEVDRRRALSEAHRVLRGGGLLYAACIVRYASLQSALLDDMFGDDDFHEMLLQDLRDGQHRNPPGRDFFTTAVFHHPDEFEAELTQSPFDLVEVCGVEGPAKFMPALASCMDDPRRRGRLLDVLRLIEKERSLFGASTHLMAIARKPMI